MNWQTDTRAGTILGTHLWGHIYDLFTGAITWRRLTRCNWSTGSTGSTGPVASTGPTGPVASTGPTGPIGSVTHAASAIFTNVNSLSGPNSTSS